MAGGARRDSTCHLGGQCHAAVYRLEERWWPHLTKAWWAVDNTVEGGCPVFQQAGGGTLCWRPEKVDHHPASVA